MKKIILTLTAAAALVAATAPAATAQPWRDNRDTRGAYSYEGRPITATVDGLEWRINSALRDGRINRGEHRRLMDQYREAKRLAWPVQNGRGGPQDRARLDRIVSQVMAATEARGPRYGYNDPRYRNN